MVGFINALQESVKSSKMTETQITDVSKNAAHNILEIEAY